MAEAFFHLQWISLRISHDERKSGDRKKVLVQVAVALMDKMQLVSGSPEEAAEQFATQLFDSWGVGEADCGNGVVLLLSRSDRQVSGFEMAHFGSMQALHSAS